MVHTPGMFRYWLNMARQDRRLAFGQMVNTFPGWPAAMVFDILDGKVELTYEENAVSFKWEGPMAAPDEYLYEWKTVYPAVSGDRRVWLESRLDECLILHRRQTFGDREVVQVPEIKAAEAGKFLYSKIDGKFVKDYPDDDPIFRDYDAGGKTGKAWDLDNVEDPA